MFLIVGAPIAFTFFMSWAASSSWGVAVAVTLLSSFAWLLTIEWLDRGR